MGGEPGRVTERGQHRGRGRERERKKEGEAGRKKDQLGEAVLRMRRYSPGLGKEAVWEWRPQQPDTKGGQRPGVGQRESEREQS